MPEPGSLNIKLTPDGIETVFCGKPPGLCPAYTPALARSGKNQRMVELSISLLIPTLKVKLILKI